MLRSLIFSLTENESVARMKKRNKLVKIKLKKERNYSMCMSREGS